MIKPILIKVENPIEGVAYPLIEQSGYFFDNGTCYDIILIDTEAKIVEDDYVFDNYAGINNIQIVRKCDLSSSHNRNGNWSKIIASTDKSHTVDLGHLCLDILPQLSNNSIQLLINYYNEHKVIPKSVDVKEETRCTICGATNPKGSLVCQYPNCQNKVGVIMSTNQQGEVDITIPEVGKCPACGASNPEWARVCQYPRCQTSLNKPLPEVEEKLYSIDEISKLFVGEKDKGGFFYDWLDYRLDTKDRITFKEWFNSKKK